MEPEPGKEGKEKDRERAKGLGGGARGSAAEQGHCSGGSEDFGGSTAGAEARAESQGEQAFLPPTPKAKEEKKVPKEEKEEEEPEEKEEEKEQEEEEEEETEDPCSSAGPSGIPLP